MLAASNAPVQRPDGRCGVGAVSSLAGRLRVEHLFVSCSIVPLTYTNSGGLKDDPGWCPRSGTARGEYVVTSAMSTLEFCTKAFVDPEQYLSTPAGYERR